MRVGNIVPLGNGETMEGGERGWYCAATGQREQGSGSLMGTETGKRCGGSGSSLGRDAVGGGERRSLLAETYGGLLSRSYYSVCHLYECAQATKQLVNIRAILN